jgi:hypothetical protein
MWAEMQIVFVVGVTASQSLKSFYLANFTENTSVPSIEFLLSGSFHHTIHIIKHVIPDCDNVMQCDRISLRHPQGSVSA